MNARTRVIVSAGGVLLAGTALAAFAFFGVYAAKVEEVRESIEKSLLFQFHPNEVVAGEVHTPKEVVRFERSGPGWMLTAPVHAKGDTQTIKRLLETIANAASGSKIDVPEGSAGKYGLDDPETKVVFTLASGAEAELDVGFKSDFDGRYYVRNRAVPSAALVESDFVRSVGPGAFALREKQVFDWSPQSITALTATRDGHKIYSVLKQADRWSLETENGLKPADRPEVLRLLETLLNTRASAFVDDSGSDQAVSAFGLASPRMTLTLTSSAGTTKSVRLGSFVEPTTTRWYLKVDGEKPIVEVVDTLLQDLTRTPSDLEDRRLFDFDEAKIDKVRISVNGRTEVLTRSGATEWTLGGKKAKGYKVAGIIHTLSTVRAFRNDTTDPGPKDLEHAGLKTPRISVELFTQDAARATLLVGKPLKESKDEIRVLAVGTKRISVIRSSDLESIPDDLGELLESTP